VQLSAGRPPRYSGKCAHLSADEIRRKREEGLPATLRFRVPKNQAVEFEDEVRGPQRFAGEDIGDFIIRRADGSPQCIACNMCATVCPAKVIEIDAGFDPADEARAATRALSEKLDRVFKQALKK